MKTIKCLGIGLLLVLAGCVSTSPPVKGKGSPTRTDAVSYKSSFKRPRSGYQD